jgi:hypothetical protein
MQTTKQEYDKDIVLEIGCGPFYFGKVSRTVKMVIGIDFVPQL